MSFSWSFNRIVVKRPLRQVQPWSVGALFVNVGRGTLCSLFPIVNSDSIMLSLLRVMTIDVFSKTYTSRVILPRLQLRWWNQVMKEKENLPVDNRNCSEKKIRSVMSETYSTVQLFFYNPPRALTAAALMIEKCAFKAQMNSKAGLRRQINGKLFSFRGCF